MFVSRRPGITALPAVFRPARAVAWAAIVVVLGLSLLALSNSPRRTTSKMGPNSIVSPWDTSAAPPAGDPHEVRVKHSARATVTAETTGRRRARRDGSGAKNRN